MVGGKGGLWGLLLDWVRWGLQIRRVVVGGIGLGLAGLRWQLGVDRVGVDCGWVVDGLEPVLVQVSMVVSDVGVSRCLIGRGTVLFRELGSVVISPVVGVAVALVARVARWRGSIVGRVTGWQSSWRAVGLASGGLASGRPVSGSRWALLRSLLPGADGLVTLVLVVGYCVSGG